MGCGQRQALIPIDGYLNTIAVSPDAATVEPVKLAGTAGNEARSGKIPILPRGSTGIYPSFSISSILMPAGSQRLTLLDQSKKL